MNWIDKAFGIHPQAMSVLSQRSSVLAANIANADTPQYLARDIDFKDVLQSQQLKQKVSVDRTSERHINPAGSDGNTNLLYRVPMKEMVNGNSVEAEVEQAAFSDNALRYQTSVTFLDGTVAGLRLAIKGK